MIEKLEQQLRKLVAYVKELAKQHNELEKRVEALERGKQPKNMA